MDDATDIEPVVSREPTVLPRHVRHALAHMRDNLPEKITLPELASVCAVPERTLLKQFQKFLGLPPLAYLRRLRLNAAKSRLAEVDRNDAIADIAMSCGFAHLGRFASEYRRAFGESPSATRQRARDRVADAVTAERRASRSAEHAASLPTSTVWRAKPSLLILPLRTETLEECREGRDLTERLGATLSRMRIATVGLAHPLRAVSMNALPQPRNGSAAYCLLGRLTQHGDRVRVIIRLVDAATDRHVWGDSFDGSVHDPFELQDRVVDGVLCGVVSRITDAEVERVHKKDPRDLAARDLALQALRLALHTNVPSARKAISVLDRAMDLDPANALAVALSAHCHTQLLCYHGTSSPGATREAALRLYHRAGMLDDGDPLVTTARGAVATLLLGPDEADALVTRALAMDPTSSWTWERRGFTRRIAAQPGCAIADAAGPDSAIADFQRALQLRVPAMPRSNCFLGIASSHRSAGRLQAAIVWRRKAIVENPDAGWLYRELARDAFAMGDRPGVVQAIERLRRAHPDLSVSLLGSTGVFCDPDWLDEAVRAGLPLT